MLAAIGAAFGLTFLAEFGDKTQLVLLGLASGGRRLAVWGGAVAAFAVLTIAAVALGGLVGILLPTGVATLVAGLLFLVFGVLALLRADAQEEEPDSVRGVRSALVTSFLLVAAAEMGDKTQVALVALAAAQGHPIATALGGIAALAAVSALPLLIGRALAGRVAPRTIRLCAAGLFLAIGATFLVTAIL